MKVRAAICDGTPCSLSEIENFDTLTDVRQALREAAKYTSAPFATVYPPHDDYPICQYELGPRGGLIRRAA